MHVNVRRRAVAGAVAAIISLGAVATLPPSEAAAVTYNPKACLDPSQMQVTKHVVEKAPVGYNHRQELWGYVGTYYKDGCRVYQPYRVKILRSWWSLLP